MKAGAAPLPPRVAAARAVHAVVRRGRNLDQALAGPIAQRPLAQALAYTTLRRYWSLEARVRQRLRRPLKARDADLHALLLVGACELTHLDTPPHAAVSQTVEAAVALGKPWARGLVNAVLRGLQRDPGTPPEDPQARHDHPAWLLEALARAWPDDWPAIVAVGNRPPPMTLRVADDRAAALERLAAAGIDARPHPHVAGAVILAEPRPVGDLPGFAEGRLSVQDASAQLAAPLLDARPGMRVLDACAAPGGKTGHLLQHTPELDLTALDRDPKRLEAVADNLARLGVAARLVSADAGVPETWWDGRPFDRILLDAPCSATGVIDRHPDIKHLRRPEDIPALARTQARLLDALWPTLAPGGILVYATCSLLPEENAERVAAFLDRHPDARPLPIEAPWGRPAGAGRQILPGRDEAMDGFFYARLEKRR